MGRELGREAGGDSAKVTVLGMRRTFPTHMKIKPAARGCPTQAGSGVEGYSRGQSCGHLVHGTPAHHKISLSNGQLLLPFADAETEARQGEEPSQGLKVGTPALNDCCPSPLPPPARKRPLVSTQERVSWQQRQGKVIE